jgi:hypothetical protein
VFDCRDPKYDGKRFVGIYYFLKSVLCRRINKEIVSLGGNTEESNVGIT